MVSAAPPGVAQAALQCPECAGQCVWDPSQRGLSCQSCGTVQDLTHPDDHEARIEYGYDPDAPELEPASRPAELEHSCQTCGGSVLFTGAALSERCPYCDGPVVLSQASNGYDTMALIPFRVAEHVAQANTLDWVKGRIAAPSNLSEYVTQGRVAGLYAPFWTFDSDEAVNYWAKYTTGSGDNKRTHSISGKMSIEFDDLLVPASQHVTPLIRDGILHEFQPGRLRPYRSGYLSGFAAERHHQSVAEGLGQNRSDKDLLIRNRIKRHIARNRVHGIRYRTDTTGIHYRRVLLPVWILHYDYAGKRKKVVVSGIDGRTFGERPFSPWKLAGYAGALSAVVIALGLAWGGAGLL
ncbi:MAG: hypothetical protein AB8B82_00505 [Roseovarius sp.]